MRIEIKTNEPVKDRDIQALFLIGKALSLCHDWMIVPTLEYFADKYGYRLVRK